MAGAPDSAAGALALAEQKLYRGEVKDAMGLLERVIKAQPKNVDAIDLYARAATDAGNHELALKALKKAIGLAPKVAHRWMDLAQIQSGATALKCYRQGIVLMQEEAGRLGANEMARRRVLRDVASGCASIAELYVTDLCDEPNAEKECEKALSDALTASKESPEAYYGLANLRFIQKRVEEAKNALGSCLALVRARAKDDHKLYVEPGERGDGVNLTYEFKSSVALLCLEIGMTDAASELVELLLEEDDTVPATWYYGALCFNAANESAEARKCAQKALALLAAAGQGADPELRAAVQAALKQAETASAGAAGAAGAAGGAAMDTD